MGDAPDCILRAAKFVMPSERRLGLEIEEVEVTAAVLPNRHGGYESISLHLDNVLVRPFGKPRAEMREPVALQAMLDLKGQSFDFEHWKASFVFGKG
ncbi:MAG TPA: hypothetical protein VLT82_12215 [Myxococcaceae bacterium]|nr:hypothetical protein [Myxococcaceae bacterium]